MTYLFGVLSGATISVSLGGSSSDPPLSLIRCISPLFGLMDFKFPPRILCTASFVNKHLSSGSAVWRTRCAKPSSELGRSSGSATGGLAALILREGPASGVASETLNAVIEGSGGSANSTLISLTYS